jgi:hypothetical protein
LGTLIAALGLLFTLWIGEAFLILLGWRGFVRREESLFAKYRNP